LISGCQGKSKEGRRKEHKKGSLSVDIERQEEEEGVQEERNRGGKGCREGRPHRTWTRPREGGGGREGFFYEQQRQAQRNSERE
jgi:hypothetical protein